PRSGSDGRPTSSPAAAAAVVTLGASAATAATPFINLFSDDNQVAKAANTPVALNMSGDPTGGLKVQRLKDYHRRGRRLFRRDRSAGCRFCHGKRLSLASAERQGHR